MKRLHGAWLLALLAASGCLTAHSENKGTSDLQSVLNFEYRNRVPVTAESTTPENAHQQALALAEELDRERNAEMLTPAGPAAKR